MCRPLCSERSTCRVQANTLQGVYLPAILKFVKYVNRTAPMYGLELSRDVLSFLAGEYAVFLSNTEVRPFHAGLNFFMPFLDRSRVTAELKGLERMVPTVPTTPFTYELVISLAIYALGTLGPEQAVGVIVGFFGLLRSAEIIQIRGVDVLLRCASVFMTTIRLSKTKSNREQVVQFTPNSLPERALAFLLGRPHNHYTALFGFRNYSQLYQLVLNWRTFYEVRILFTPHSLRAGGATYLRMLGWNVTEIADIGRWSDLVTARSYIDVVFALTNEVLQLHARVVADEYGLIAILVAPW